MRDKVGNGAQCCFDKLSGRLECMLTCENHAESEKQNPREASQHQKVKGGILGKSTGSDGLQVEVVIVVQCSWRFAKLGRRNGGETVLVETAEMEGDEDDVIMK